MATINIDDIVINFDGVSSGTALLNANESKSIIRRRLFAEDPGAMTNEGQLANVIYQLIPNEYRTEEALNTLNYIPILSQLVNYTDGLTLQLQNGSITVTKDVMQQVPTLIENEQEFYGSQIYDELSAAYPNVSYTDMLAFVEQKTADVSQSGASVKPVLTDLEALPNEPLSVLFQEFNQYALDNNVVVDPANVNPRDQATPPTTTQPMDVAQQAETNVTGQQIRNTQQQPPVDPPEGAVTSFTIDVAQQAEENAPQVRTVFDWSGFTTDDVRWLLQENSTLDAAISQLYQNGQSILDQAIAGVFDLPDDVVLSLDDFVNYATFDLIGSEELAWFNEPADAFEEANLSLAMRLPYFTNERGMAELTKKLDYAGYFKDIGGYPARPNDPSDPYFTAAYKQLLRDTIAGDTNLASVLSQRAQVRIDEFDKQLKQIRGQERLSLNLLARDMLGRDLLPSELERVLSLVNTFSEEERLQYMSSGQRPEDLTVSGVRAIQDIAGPELQRRNVGRSLRNLASFDLRNFISRPVETFVEPQL
jgi:hypothetical protein